jgi:hypothetical protein
MQLTEALEEKFNAVRLGSGSHPSPDVGMCVMELARDAARAAAGAAAGDDLAPTVETLQGSALKLLDAMIEVSK